MAVNFEIPTETIKVGKGGTFTVRGLDTEDVVFLTSVYLEDIKVLIAKFGNKSGVMPRSAVAELVMEIAKSFPMMTAEIVSRCADAPDEVEKFRHLPFAKNIEALKAIAILSVEDGHELKNLAGGLASLLEANGLQLGPLSKSLQTIINQSEKPSAT